MSKSAKEMFEEMGYEEYIEDEMNTIITTLIRDRGCASYIAFFDVERLVRVHDLSVYGDVEPHYIRLKELQAINQMCKELGWIDEE